MEYSLYDRIQKLCEERGINVTRLESDCGLGNSTIKKWRTTSPNVNKIKLVAQYFDVTIDYLLGLTDIPIQADKVLDDDDIVSIQRAKRKMTKNDSQRMMTIVRNCFSDAFTE